ncbi:MAG TPA: SAM-dependent chlorinase/fluorinase [Lacipirellulaceae bacterium]|nr:SAM-dependent chlorinase/fluorinase [Lacipirellulaceae bacterium]
MAAENEPPPIITLTTDFGTGSRYVAAMKGVILSINPRATIVDISHSVLPQNIRAGAIVLANSAPWFPPNTIHVSVIDPGVGSRRRIVYARIGSQQFVAPDNGLLSRLAMMEQPSTIISIEDPRHWLPNVSRTFHGRDIMAPVAARLSLGLSPDELGPMQDQLVEIPWPEAKQVPNRIEGEVIEVDSFGNLITNITREMLDKAARSDSVVITCDEHETQGIFSTFSEQPPMTFVAHIGSTNHLELAIVNDNASAMLGVKVGAPVHVAW